MTIIAQKCGVIPQTRPLLMHGLAGGVLPPSRPLSGGLLGSFIDASVRSQDPRLRVEIVEPSSERAAAFQREVVHDGGSFRDRELRAFDEVGKIGFEERQRGRIAGGSRPRGRGGAMHFGAQHFEEIGAGQIERQALLACARGRRLQIINQFINKQTLCSILE